MTIQLFNIGTVTEAAASPIVLSGVNVPSGATIFTMCTNGESNTNAPVPSDSVNGAYSNIGEELLGGGSVNGSCRMSYFPNSATLSNATITFTPQGSGGFGNSMSAFYATGLGAIRASTLGINFTTPVTMGAACSVGDLVVGGIGMSGTFTTQDSSLPWATPFTAANFVGGGTLISTSNSALSYSPTVTGNVGAVIIAFAPGASGGGGGGTNPTLNKEFFEEVGSLGYL